MPKTEVVIVGGSSGAMLAAKLSAARAKFNPATHNLTLVTQLPYNVHIVAGARLAVTKEGDLDTTEKAFIPFDKLFKPGHAGRVVIGKVTQVLEGRLELADGSFVPYDYLVLATGSVWHGPMNFDLSTDTAVHEHLDKWRKIFAAAKRVVLVGGGATGIELAGEVKYFFPKSSVILASSDNKPLNALYPDKYRDRLARRLEDHGVTLALGERVIDLPADGLWENGQTVSVHTEKGTTFEGDLIIPAFGPLPNTSILKNFRNGSALSPQGFVHVTPTLNVKFGDTVSKKIFAIGDIIEWNEQHSLAKGIAHAGVVLTNLLSSINSGDSEGKIGSSHYKGTYDLMFLTIGPEAGVGYLPFLWGITFGDWLVRTLKSRYLLVGMIRWRYNL